MAVVSFDIPEGVFRALGQDPASLARALRQEVAVRWYATKRLSQGRAAELAGLSRAAFLKLLADQKVEVFHVDQDDLADEVARG